MNQSIEKIIEELKAKISEVGPDIRDDARLKRDAQLVFAHRCEGIEVETLCMMITDLECANNTLRLALVELADRAMISHDHSLRKICNTKL